ncbi:Eukaryotic/viral aspartic protease [Phytophthora megakarya]|uniref:Eukaryotic/viral aspartic protease n=1 Tax=Phytophthora megakarya TaxID=4795 RepID=A0A225VRV6_9STRA|nr:Eukaryotic/viral aspartic protease [Phytophthora megakarya]
MAQLQEPRKFRMRNRGELADMGKQPEEDALVTTGVDVAIQVSGIRSDKCECDPGEGSTQGDDRGDALLEARPELTIELEDHQDSEMPLEVLPESENSGYHPEKASCTPLEKLEMEYERCMWLDLEPGVYTHEGSEMLVQLRDQLSMLPELSELHPKCDIDQADVGVPGETSPEDESRMRVLLKHHRKIFLGDGNAAPAPARGVPCDLDGEMSNPSRYAQDRLVRT